MITDSLENAAMYRSISPNLAKGLDFLRHTDLLALPVGKVVIDGEKVFALVQEYQTKAGPQIIWEAHKKYIDIQYVARGQEKLGFAWITDLKITKPYDEKNDAMLGETTGDFVTLPAGRWVIFYPTDAHAPCLAVNEPMAVKKIVVKVAVG